MVWCGSHQGTACKGYLNEWISLGTTIAPTNTTLPVAHRGRQGDKWPLSDATAGSPYFSAGEFERGSKNYRSPFPDAEDINQTFFPPFLDSIQWRC